MIWSREGAVWMRRRTQSIQFIWSLFSEFILYHPTVHLQLPLWRQHCVCYVNVMQWCKSSFSDLTSLYCLKWHKLKDRVKQQSEEVEWNNAMEKVLAMAADDIQRRRLFVTVKGQQYKVVYCNCFQPRVQPKNHKILLRGLEMNNGRPFTNVSFLYKIFGSCDLRAWAAVSMKPERLSLVEM